MNVRYSLHAEMQMAARGIGRANVLGVIISTEPIKRQDGRLRYENDALIVVTSRAPDGRSELVITAFHNSPPRKPKRKYWLSQGRTKKERTLHRRKYND